MSELNPKAGDWIVYLSRDFYMPRYASGMVEKRTPKQVRIAKSDLWDKIVRPLSVVAILPDEDAARKFKQAIDGAVGTFERSHRTAERIRSEAITRARQTLAATIDRLVARLEGEAA